MPRNKFPQAKTKFHLEQRVNISHVNLSVKQLYINISFQSMFNTCGCTVTAIVIQR